VKGIPAGSHTLSVLAGSGAVGVHRSVTVKSRKTAQVGTLSLTTGGQITGLVSRINTENGEPAPLAGVEVVAEPDVKNDGTVRPSDAHLLAVTDESGAYQFRAVPTGGYRISVVVPGLAAGVEYVWVEAGHTSVADFLLDELIEDGVGTVAGTVVDSEGAAVEGAMVTVYSTDYYPDAVTATSQQHAIAAGKGAGAVPGALPRGSFSTLTDQHGNYTLNVPSGHLWVDIWADGYLPAGGPLTLHPRESLRFDATLELDTQIGLGVIEGYVTDAETGDPIRGARVMTLIPTLRMGLVPVPDAETDENGYYRLETFFVGVVPVGAIAEGYEMQSQEVDLSKGSAAVNFALTRSKETRKRNRK
jgi:hypothetical protein